MNASNTYSRATVCFKFEMTLAFVLINVDPGSEGELMQELRSIEHVKEVRSVFGLYDVIVMVEAESESCLKDTIFPLVRQLRNVRTTLTMRVADS